MSIYHTNQENDYLDNLIEKCTNLRELGIFTVGGYLDTPFPMNVQIASVKCLKLDTRQAVEILRSNPQATYVQTTPGYIENWLDDLIQIIPHLEKLQLGCYHFTAARIVELRQLRSLIILQYIYNMEEFLHIGSTFVSLEELGFGCSPCAQPNWAYLAEMNSLKEIRIRLDSFVASGLEEFFAHGNCTSLRSIKIACNKKVDFSYHVWSRIIAACQHRKISLTVLGNASFSSEDEYAKEEAAFYNKKRNDRVIHESLGVVFIYRRPERYHRLFEQEDFAVEI